MTKTKRLLKAMICILIAAAVVASCFAVISRRERNKYKNEPLDLPSGFTYTAHAGCVNTPDNSLESIDAGVEYGAQIVEIDLNFDKNNVPVLSHNKPKANAVTLDEAFKKVSEYENLKVNVDVKSMANLSEVAVIAEKYGITDRIFFTGISQDRVAGVQSACPNIPYYLGVDVVREKNQDEEYLLSLVQLVKDNNAIGINFNKNNATKALVDIFHENGLLVSVWTVNSEKDIYKMLSFAPDNITTRRPDRMSEILRTAG